jgi:hypothetical protein
MSLSQKDKILIDGYAIKIVDKGWGTMAIMLFDSIKYLNNVGSQLLHVLSPTLTMVPYLSEFFKNSEQISEILEDRDNVEYFITRIEYFMNENNNKKLLDKNNSGVKHE